MNGRERILARLRGEPVDSLPCMPITMQIAARRIGACYREYATDYRVLAEGQLRIAEEFDLDYVNTMSDPAIEAADCGGPVDFPEDATPILEDTRALLADKSVLLGLKAPAPCGGGRMTNRIRGVALLKERTAGEKLVEGWIEGPCAEAADLRGMNRLMLDFIDDPAFVRDLFDFVLEMELDFARAQVAAGAEMIGIGDAAASLVGPRIYEEFVYPYEKRMVDGVRALGVPAHLHICGNTRRIAKGMGSLGCAIVDLDYPVPVSEARAAMGPDQILLGNIDPVRVLEQGTPDSIRAALAECHRQAGARYVVGAGCEVTRDTPPENLRALVEYGRGQAG